MALVAPVAEHNELIHQQQACPRLHEQYEEDFSASENGPKKSNLIQGDEFEMITGQKITENQDSTFMY